AYSTIFKAFVATPAATTTINDPNSWWLAPLARWGQSNTLTTVFGASRMGEDYASAIALLVEGTEAAVENKLRQASSQHSFGEQGYEATTGGVTGPRVQILDDIL